jgi:PAS domain S-box-containing protein
MNLATAENKNLILTKTNVLVVDDRPDGLLALEAVLTSDSYNLIQANSGRKALECASEQDFAVILLDVQMPEMDGFECARLLREHPRTRTTPIIFVTAINKEERHINQGYESGAVDYIFKPLDPFILRSKVDIFVDIFNKNMQIQRQAALLREMEAEKKERQLFELSQESIRRYVSLADAVPHIILKIQFDGKVEYFNQRWYEYTGLNPQTQIDMGLVIHPKDRRKIFAFWLRLQHHHLQASQVEVRIRNVADGIYRWHLVRVVAEIKNNEVIGWIATGTDIDNVKRAEEKFRSLSQELNRSNKELEEFAYVASHDLKEPLHVVSSFVCLLEKRLKTKLQDNEAEYFGFIKQGVEQARVLIKDLLEYSRIGKEKTLEMVDAASVLKEACEHLKLAIDESAAIIHYGPMPQIKANRLGMVQLFQNLIGNAIKYKGENIPEITIIAKPTKAHGWCFMVRDNGIGIDPQFQGRVFDMFQRLHARNEYSGTGVGLAICKKIVENHGGKIWIESQLGQGATFCFTIPQSS